MFSKAWELIGAAMVAIAIGNWATWQAGLLFGGLFVLVTGATIDDDALGARARRATAWVRYAYWRQVIREGGGEAPRLRWKSPAGWVSCSCGSDPDCPVCSGSGVLPDPNFRTNPRSPHPPIKIDPQAQTLATSLARARQERAKLGDRTPALSRPSPADELERLA